MIKTKINRLIWKLGQNFGLVLMIISFVSFFIIFLQIIGINDLLHANKLIFLEIVLNGFNFVSTAYVLLLLPSYPIYFLSEKFECFNSLEKIGLTIITNLSIYILAGVFGQYLTIPLIPLYFFSITFCLYMIFIINSVILTKKVAPVHDLQTKMKKIEKEVFISNFSIRKLLKKYISLNQLLLIIFIFLFILLDFVRDSYFVGTDPWIHLSIIRGAIETAQLPMEEYYGAMGLHVFSLVFTYFSGIDLMLIPRVYLLYSFPISGLIIYCLFKRIFKNTNLAVIGVFILTFSSLGFMYMMYQYWPSGLALLQMLMIFLILYIRQRIFIKELPPSKEKTRAGIFQSFIPIILIFTSSLITHSLITMIILISYLWIYVVFFVVNFRRGVDLFLLLGLVGIFMVFLLFGINTGHFRVFNYIIDAYPPLLIILGLLGGASLLILPLWFFKKHTTFSKNIYEQVISGKRRNFFTRLSDKHLFLGVSIFGIIFSISFFIINLLVLNADISFVLVGFELILFILFSLFGIGVFQYKPRGKSLWLWFLALAFLVLAGILFNSLTETLNFFTRIFYISSIIIVIGFVSYLHKLIQNGLIKDWKAKIFIAFIVSYSLIASFIDINNSVDFFSFKNHEIDTIDWYSSYTSNKNVIIAEYGWEHVFVYYNYPFGSTNVSFKGIHVYIYADNIYMLPSNHVLENGTNILRQIKMQNPGSNVYLLLSDYYLLPSGSSLFGRLDSDQVEAYYNLDYLNRIFSAKLESGEDQPIYWVI